METRRSMGAGKLSIQPKRSSVTGMGVQSSGKSQSMGQGGSKLPKLKTAATLHSHRSSSIDSQSSRRDQLSGRRATSSTRATSATRSPSKYQTPVRTSRKHLMPLSGANSGGSVRSNYPFGRESMTPNHRESVKVPLKDTRPLTEKSWQLEKTRELIDFCKEMNYPGILSTSSFPLSTTEFRKIFEFLIQFLQPDFNMPKNQDMGLELPPLLKKLGYPGTVSKSTFQTIGTQHSWPTTLGVLHYLYLRAKISMIDIREMVRDCSNDPVDDEGEMIVFDHFVATYQAFNNEIDDYQDYLIDLEEKFMSLYEIDQQILDTLNQKFASYQKEYEGLRSSSFDIERLVKEKEAKEEDLKRVEDYFKQTDSHLKNKQEECLILEKRLNELSRQRQTLKASVIELERFCREEKGVNLDEASSKEYEVNELEKQVAQKRKALEEADAVLWKTEQALSKRLDNVDHLCQEFNLTLMKLTIENSVALKLDRQKHPDEIRPMLYALLDELRAREKSLKESSIRCEAELGTLKQQLNKKVAEVKRSEEELKKKRDEHDLIIRKIETESADLAAALETTKGKVLSHSDRDKKDLRSLESDMKRAQVDLESFRKERDEKLGECLELIRAQNSVSMELQDKMMKEREEAIRAYKEKAHQMIQALKLSRTESEDLVNSFPKFKF